MSDETKDQTTASLEALAARTGRIPGGCEDCDAYQTVSKIDDLVFEMLVHHDDTCPFYLSLPPR